MARTFTLIFLMFFDAAVKLAGDSEVKGSLEPVRVLVGQDVILPCYVQPARDVTNLTVDWGLGEIHVHVYRDGKDYHAPQDNRFKGRTSLFGDQMDKGNISLKLSTVNFTDAGNYRCFVPELRRKGHVQLIVEAPTPHAENKGSGTEGGSNSDETDVTGCGTGCVIAVIAVIAMTSETVVIVAIVAIVVTVVIAVIAAILTTVVFGGRYLIERRNRRRRQNEGPNEVVEMQEMLKKEMQN